MASHQPVGEEFHWGLDLLGVEEVPEGLAQVPAVLAKGKTERTARELAWPRWAANNSGSARLPSGNWPLYPLAGP